MPELSNTDREAVDRPTFFMLKEVCRSAADAMAQLDPPAARALLNGVEALITGAIVRIDAQQSEGSNSTAIALAVGGRIAEVLDQACAAPGEDLGNGPGGRPDGAGGARSATRSVTSR